MVITSSSPNDDSNSVEPSESVEEPPIRPLHGPQTDQVVTEKVVPGHTPGGGRDLSQEEVCKYAHTVETARLAEQLEVDLRYFCHPAVHQWPLC